MNNEYININVICMRELGINAIVSMRNLGLGWYFFFIVYLA
jgi:hypothetical protein